MAGRFEGLTDAERELFRNIFPSGEQRGRGRPAVASGNILYSLLYILIVGCESLGDRRRNYGESQQIKDIILTR